MRGTPEVPREIVTLEQLHHDVGAHDVRGVVEDRDDVGMVELGGGQGLAQGARRIVGQAGAGLVVRRLLALCDELLARLSGTVPRVPGPVARRAWSRRTVMPRVFREGVQAIDWNGDGIINPGAAGIHELFGDQALVFWLGGIPRNSSGGPVPSGFSEDPRNPASAVAAAWRPTVMSAMPKRSSVSTPNWAQRSAAARLGLPGPVS